MIRVIIADDQPLVREGIKYILEQDDEMEILGCAANGTEAYELCQKHLPDVVLMDLSMPFCDGIAGTRKIKERFAQVKIIILTTYNNPDDVVKVMDAGADSYLLKDIDPDKLLISIKNVMMGYKVIHDDAYQSYISGLNSSKSENEMVTKFKLNDRDIQIIRMIVEGSSNKEISANLGVTDSIVRNAISGILSRLNLQDRTQLAVFSIKNKIV